MPTVDEKRWALYKAYPGSDWLADVAAMTDKQVETAYRQHVKSGRIEPV